MRKLTAILIGILSLSIVALAYSAQLDVSPAQQNIDVGKVGHYTLTLTTGADPIGGNLGWATDDAKVIAAINGAPTAQFGSFIIPTSSTCSGSPLSCTQTFDLQVMPESGVTVNTLHDVTVTFQDQKGVAKAMVTASANPVPELATGVLMSAGLIGLVGLTRYRKKKE